MGVAILCQISFKETWRIDNIPNGWILFEQPAELPDLNHSRSVLSVSFFYYIPIAFNNSRCSAGWMPFRIWITCYKFLAKCELAVREPVMVFAHWIIKRSSSFQLVFADDWPICKKIFLHILDNYDSHLIYPLILWHLATKLLKKRGFVHACTIKFTLVDFKFASRPRNRFLGYLEWLDRFRIDLI